MMFLWFCCPGCHPPAVWQIYFTLRWRRRMLPACCVNGGRIFLPRATPGCVVHAFLAVLLWTWRRHTSALFLRPRACEGRCWGRAHEAWHCVASAGQPWERGRRRGREVRTSRHLQLALPHPPLPPPLLHPLLPLPAPTKHTWLPCSSAADRPTGWLCWP